MFFNEQFYRITYMYREKINNNKFFMNSIQKKKSFHRKKNA
jgi:hypothetical protein